MWGRYVEMKLMEAQDGKSGKAAETARKLAFRNLMADQSPGAAPAKGVFKDPAARFAKKES